METPNEIVQRIDKVYVGEDCVQVMMPYKEVLTIINPEGMVYHHKPGSTLYVNKYLDDERRIQFPYSNIPTHFSRKGLDGKVRFTNQLLNFETPYIVIGDGVCNESYVTKDRDTALLISVINEPNVQTTHMNRDELLKFIEKSDPNEQIFYVYISGGVQTDVNKVIPKEEEIHEFIKKLYFSYLSNLERYTEFNTSTGMILRQNPWLIEYPSKNIKHMDFTIVDFNVRVDDPIIIVRINDGKIKMQCLVLTYVKDSDFVVEINDIPVTKYNLEQLRLASKIYPTKAPKIPLKLNPGVSRKDIVESKQMVRQLKKYNNK